MRIISGSLKGRKINFYKSLKTRPLKDSVKENIFNILKHSNLIKIEIENSNILDLYSGFGSFGIESLSRGAKKVTFIDQDLKASNILKENLVKLSLIDKSEIFIDRIENVLISKIKEKFNIFFFDPPFIDFNFLNNLKFIKKKKFFDSSHIVIIHRERETEDDFRDIIKIIETKQYGRSKILYGIFN